MDSQNVWQNKNNKHNICSTSIKFYCDLCIHICVAKRDVSVHNISGLIVGYCCPAIYTNISLHKKKTFVISWDKLFYSLSEACALFQCVTTTSKSPLSLDLWPPRFYSNIGKTARRRIRLAKQVSLKGLT
jgi:hypothetical protein